MVLCLVLVPGTGARSRARSYAQCWCLVQCLVLCSVWCLVLLPCTMPGTVSGTMPSTVPSNVLGSVSVVCLVLSEHGAHLQSYKSWARRNNHLPSLPHYPGQSEGGKCCSHPSPKSCRLNLPHISAGTHRQKCHLRCRLPWPQYGTPSHLNKKPLHKTNLDKMPWREGGRRAG